MLGEALFEKLDDFGRSQLVEKSFFEVLMMLLSPYFIDFLYPVDIRSGLLALSSFLSLSLKLYQVGIILPSFNCDPHESLVKFQQIIGSYGHVF